MVVYCNKSVWPENWNILLTKEFCNAFNWLAPKFYYLILQVERSFQSPTFSGVSSRVLLLHNHLFSPPHVRKSLYFTVGGRFPWSLNFTVSLIMANYYYICANFQIGIHCFFMSLGCMLFWPDSLIWGPFVSPKHNEYNSKNRGNTNVFLLNLMVD